MAADSSTAEPRTPLSRERVLAAAVALADEHGIEAVSMRRLGQELGVEAMSLYNHVANKEDLLTGIADAVVAEMTVADDGPDWRATLRQTVLGARTVLLRHEWAPKVIEGRKDLTPTMLQHYDGVVGIFLRAGFSADLTHHAIHVLGSRALGFTQELFDDSGSEMSDPEVAAMMMQQMAAAYPNLGALIAGGDPHKDDDSILGDGCDSQFEFEFTLDLILDGLERLRLAEQA